ncbi:adenosylcobinamide-GDP ribazoletransferase [Mesorhizobium sp. NBSH29]|nr:adenosylcobinamide-GDP ribazoletransferase [Mesorhizobium sp. NBSH29]
MRRPQDIITDIALCVSFYTRLPVSSILFGAGKKDFAAAQWAAPLAGCVVAVISAFVYALAYGLGLPPTLCAGLALASGMLATGALHEDGLSDMADGFGGGKTRDQKLEIMRDSRIGSYGAAALVFSILLRWQALAALGSPAHVALALIAAHMASRALMPAMLYAMQPARSDGLAAGAGDVPHNSALVAAGLGFIALLPFGIVGAGVAACLAAMCAYGVGSLANRQIGGHTGDVLGAAQQMAEIALLCAAVIFLT